MELTTKILAISDKSDKKRSFQIEINGNKEWAAFWYSTNQGDKSMEEINMVKDLKKGDEAEFNVFQSGKWWNVNSIIPVEQVGGDVQADNRPDDTEDPGPIEFPVGAEKKASRMANKVTTDQFKTSSYDRCNAMNASVALLAEVFNKNSDKPMDEIARIHKELIQEVKDGACIILDEYHGK